MVVVLPPALDQFERGYAAQVKALGELHPHLIETLDYWDCAYSHSNESWQAERKFDQALELFTRHFGKDHHTSRLYVRPPGGFATSCEEETSPPL